VVSVEGRESRIKSAEVLAEHLVARGYVQESDEGRCAHFLTTVLPITYPCTEHSFCHNFPIDNCFQCGKEPCRIDFSNARVVK
jgi:hypothetical protein